MVTASGRFESEQKGFIHREQCSVHLQFGHKVDHFLNNEFIRIGFVSIVRDFTLQRAVTGVQLPRNSFQEGSFSTAYEIQTREQNNVSKDGEIGEVGKTETLVGLRSPPGVPITRVIFPRWILPEMFLTMSTRCLGPEPPKIFRIVDPTVAIFLFSGTMV